MRYILLVMSSSGITILFVLSDISVAIFLIYVIITASVTWVGLRVNVLTAVLIIALMRIYPVL